MESDIKIKLMLLHNLTQKRRGLAESLFSRRARLENLIAAVDAKIEDKCAETDAQIDELTNEIKELTLRHEASVQTEHGKAAFTAGYFRDTYNAKQLNTLLKKDADQYGWLMDFRKRSLVKPRVKIAMAEAT